MGIISKANTIVMTIRGALRLLIFFMTAADVRINHNLPIVG